MCPYLDVSWANGLRNLVFHASMAWCMSPQIRSRKYTDSKNGNCGGTDAARTENCGGNGNCGNQGARNLTPSLILGFLFLQHDLTAYVQGFSWPAHHLDDNSILPTTKIVSFTYLWLCLENLGRSWCWQRYSLLTRYIIEAPELLFDVIFVFWEGKYAKSASLRLLANNHIALSMASCSRY